MLVYRRVHCFFGGDHQSGKFITAEVTKDYRAALDAAAPDQGGPWDIAWNI